MAGKIVIIPGRSCLLGGVVNIIDLQGDPIMEACSTRCPCNPEVLLDSCCGPILFRQNAATPEQLMRSRYTAFVTHNAEYLCNTLHPSRRKANEKQLLQNSFGSIQWLGLRILKTQGNEVEFVAFHAGAHNNIEQLHERSIFVFEDNHWFYVDGVFLPPIKLGRNENCYCGSGKKLKKCCANRQP